MAKVSEKIIRDVGLMYEEGKLSNVKIADIFSEHRVSEKNIRDWAKRYGWVKGRKRSRKESNKTETPEKKKKVKRRKREPTEEEKEFAVNIEKALSDSDMSDAELVEVIQLIQDMVVAGYTKTNIKKYIATKRGIRGKLFETIYTHAIIKFAEFVSDNLKSRLGFHLYARTSLYKKAIESGNLNLAHKILEDLGKLEGLYPKSTLIDLSDLEPAKRIFKLKIPEEYRAENYVDAEVV